MRMMKAARLHEVGGKFQVDEIEKPTPGYDEIIVKVESANLVQNLRNVVSTYPIEKPFLPLPEFPAIFGFDIAGTIADVGERVRNLKPGDRVYIDTARSAVDSWETRTGDPLSDPDFAFQGYFGIGEGARALHRDYPHGGMCEYVRAPARSVIGIPDNVTFDQASRLSYIGTSYAAMRKGDVRPGSSLLILGATGTLGVDAVLLALAMGVGKIFAVARNVELLERVKAFAPDRINIISLSDQDLGDWVRSLNYGGRGADVVIDALNHTAPASVSMNGINALRRGGRYIFVGAMPEPLPIPIYFLMTRQIQIFTSLWFSTAEGEEIMRMAEAGTLELDHFEINSFSLDQANEALQSAEDRKGGFTSIIVHPHKKA